MDFYLEIIHRIFGSELNRSRFVARYKYSIPSY